MGEVPSRRVDELDARPASTTRRVFAWAGRPCVRQFVETMFRCSWPTPSLDTRPRYSCEGSITMGVRVDRAVIGTRRAVCSLGPRRGGLVFAAGSREAGF